jgi:hypothetical protein
MRQLSLLLLPLWLATMPAQAQLARSFSAATYTGVGGSQLSADFDNLKDAINLDAIGGYHLTPALPWGRLSAELNISLTVSPGKNEGPPQTTITPGGGLGGGGTTTTEPGRFTDSDNDLQAFVFAIQTLYRTPGRVYGIATLGYGLFNTSIPEIEEAGRTGLTVGGGLGFRFGENTAAAELLFTRLSGELQTIGIRFVY